MNEFGKSAPHRAAVGMTASAQAHLDAGIIDTPKFRVVWQIECYAPDGSLKWEADIDNLVVDVGLNEILDKFFKGSTYSAAHYVGLTDGTPSVAAGDTMSTHAGWTEITAYSQSPRPSYVPGTVSAKSVDNSASKATFSITGTATVGGAFLSTDGTVGGTAGILISGGAFTQGDKSVNNGDTINVQITYTASSS